jgi:hypothetical protein
MIQRGSRGPRRAIASPRSVQLPLQYGWIRSRPALMVSPRSSSALACRRLSRFPAEAPDDHSMVPGNHTTVEIRQMLPALTRTAALHYARTNFSISRRVCHLANACPEQCFDRKVCRQLICAQVLTKGNSGGAIRQRFGGSFPASVRL